MTTAEELRMWADKAHEAGGIMYFLDEHLDALASRAEAEQAENEKLRKLVRDMWRLLLATGNDDLVLTIEVNGVVKEAIDADELAKTMRELEVEVDA